MMMLTCNMSPLPTTLHPRTEKNPDELPVDYTGVREVADEVIHLHQVHPNGFDHPEKKKMV